MYVNFLELTLSPLQVLLIISAAIFSGANKAGVHGISLVCVPLLSSILGPKSALSSVMLMFLFSDSLAILVYRKINFSIMLRLLPLALLGIAFAAFIGKNLNDSGFKIMLTCILSFLIILLLLPDRYKNFLHSNKIIGNFFGFLGGFTSMAGNIGGPVMTTYLLSQSLNKSTYLGIYSSMFFTLNFIKFFVMSFYWNTVHWGTFKFLFCTIPFICIGFALGAFVVRYISKKTFYFLVTTLTICSCLYLFYTIYVI